jgi:hypothetical protein
VLTKLHLCGALAGIAPALVSKPLGRDPLWVGTPIALGDLGPFSISAFPPN